MSYMVIRRNTHKLVDTISNITMASLGVTGVGLTIDVYVLAVVEMNGYSGGAVVGTNVYKNGSATDTTRSKVELFVAGGDSYWLNRTTASPLPVGCSELAYTFQLTGINEDTVMSLSLALGTSQQQYEPRDATTEDWLDVAPCGRISAPQFVAVKFVVNPGVLTNGITKFTFSGFVDNIRLGGTR